MCISEQFFPIECTRLKRGAKLLACESRSCRFLKKSGAISPQADNNRVVRNLYVTGDRMKIQNRKNTFDTGQSVAISGRYKVSHKPHALPSDVTLLKGNYFPACASCNAPVHFQLTQGLAVESARERFRLLRSA